MKNYLSEQEARRAILDVGKRIYDRGYVAANDGNISCKISDTTILVTPTGVFPKGLLWSRISLVKMDLGGTILDGGKPSSEVKMHLRAYQENPDITGVVHAHPAAATSFSVMGMEMKKPVVAEAVLVTGNILIAPYAKPGTYDVPDSIAPFINRYNAVLLANHGALSWERTFTRPFTAWKPWNTRRVSCFAPLFWPISPAVMSRIYPGSSAGLVQIRDEMVYSPGEFRRIQRFRLRSNFIAFIKYGPDFPRSSLACSIHARLFLFADPGVHLCQYAAQPVHGNLLIHVLAPGLG